MEHHNPSPQGSVIIAEERESKIVRDRGVDRWLQHNRVFWTNRTAAHMSQSDGDNLHKIEQAKIPAWTEDGDHEVPPPS